MYTSSTSYASVNCTSCRHIVGRKGNEVLACPAGARLRRQARLPAVEARRAVCALSVIRQARLLAVGTDRAVLLGDTAAWAETTGRTDVASDAICRRGRVSALGAVIASGTLIGRFRVA